MRARRRSLRTRLVAAVLVLLALALTVIAVVTALTVREYLHRRLVDDLNAANLRAMSGTPLPAPPEPLAPGPPDGDGPPRPPRPPALREEVLAQVRDGQVVSASGTSIGDVEALTAADAAVLAAVPVGRPPRSVELVDRDDDYLAVARRSANGDVLVSGLSEGFTRGVVGRLVLTELVVAIIVLVGAGAGGLLLVRRELRPLDRVAATATRVAALPLDRGEVALAERVPDTDPRTEVGQVGAALNTLLDHVGDALTARQASETRLRRFVADASHELRTPLAAIRGYAELTRRAALPEDATHAVTRISAQAERMTTLVEDLLLLARLDAGRPLEQAPVDLTRLVLDAVGDAHVAGPDHRFALQLPDEPVEVLGDAARLAQVLTNLLANARTHTPPGTTVTTGLSVGADAVLLTVADDGPGIPAEQLPHVFERFARGSASRTRDTGSTGLGLAIVDAVVTAHGGRVEVIGSPGAAFTVHLPAPAAVAPPV